MNVLLLLFSVILGLFPLLTSTYFADAVTYEITIANKISNRRFTGRLPLSGFKFSPIVAVSHSCRRSFLTVRGYANEGVSNIARYGNNTIFLKKARQLRKKGFGVKAIAVAPGPTLPGERTTLRISVDRSHPFVTVLAMIAPSPDWIVQISNFDMYNSKTKMFHSLLNGPLFAYDAGVDVGYFKPDNSVLKVKGFPRLNIAPLVEDPTDIFGGKSVGKWKFRKILPKGMKEGM